MISKQPQPFELAIQRAAVPNVGNTPSEIQLAVETEQHRAIATRARELFEVRGCEGCHEREDWLRFSVRVKRGPTLRDLNLSLHFPSAEARWAKICYPRGELNRVVFARMQAHVNQRELRPLAIRLHSRD